MDALDDIRKEREKQRSKWGDAHDDEQPEGELSRAGALYAFNAYDKPRTSPPMDWPWEADSWKPEAARRNLVRAAALIVAEIERHDRDWSTDDD